MMPSLNRSLCLFGLCIFIQLFSIAQIKCSYHWYFGWDAGLDFSSGTCVADVTGKLRSIENCSAISDLAGNLLFYSNGQKVWDRNHSVMPNGNVTGSESANQGSIIAPKPGSNSLYYLFNTDADFRYSVVDMNLNGGMGDVTATKDVLLHKNGSEEIAGTMHCNGTDYWIMTRQLAKDTLKFKAYLLTANGISGPVTSNFTISMGSNIYVHVGHLTFSQDGSKMISSVVWLNTMHVFNFNRSTGKLSLQNTIPALNGEMLYSHALSPDATKLYVTAWNYTSNAFHYNKVLQYDLSAPNIAATRVALEDIFFNGSNTGYGWIGSVRLAPDQRIYISRWHMNNPWVINPTTAYSLDSLAVIQFPNLPGPACNYQRNAFYLKGKPTQESLPNFISNFTSTVVVLPNTQTLGIGQPTICSGSPVTLSVSGGPQSGFSYTWQPGGVSAPTIEVTPGPGTIYTLEATDANGCQLTSTTTAVLLPLPVLAVAENTMCVGSSVIQSVSGALTYTWSTGAISNTVNLIPSSGISYSVSGTGANGCVNTATFQVTAQNFPTLSVTAATICAGQAASLLVTSDPSNGISYLWIPAGETSPTLVVHPLTSGTYSVRGTWNGCSSEGLGTILVKDLEKPVTDFSYATPFCIREADPLPLVLNGFSPGGQFSSQAGLSMDGASGLINLSESQAGSYLVTYSLDQFSCTAAGSSTANVVINALPAPDLPAYIRIAPGTSSILTVKGASSFTWSPDSWISCLNCEEPVISPPESMYYCITAEKDHCISKTCVKVEVTCDIGQDYSVPNAFSPNGDGENDIFCLKGWEFCVRDFEITIFDRWGEKVYHARQPDFCWDGTYKGNLLEMDVYVYVIRSTLTDRSVISRKGNITLIR